MFWEIAWRLELLISGMIITDKWLSVV